MRQTVRLQREEGKGGCERDEGLHGYAVPWNMGDDQLFLYSVASFGRWPPHQSARVRPWACICGAAPSADDQRWIDGLWLSCSRSLVLSRRARRDRRVSTPAPNGRLWNGRRRVRHVGGVTGADRSWRLPCAGRLAVLAQVHEAIAPAAEGDDQGLDIDPALAACVQLALAGPRLAPPPEHATRPPLTVSAFGMQLHAATTVDGRDRKQLERLCRYMLRPPFAHDAVQVLEGGHVRVHFKAPWRSGAAHADMRPGQVPRAAVWPRPAPGLPHDEVLRCSRSTARAGVRRDPGWPGRPRAAWTRRSRCGGGPTRSSSST